MVTRGNVAIYCYNALTAKTWDVVESTDGSLTSSSKGETILAKYFSDFVNEAGDMKLVEGAEVTATAVNDTELGANQIELDATSAEFEGKRAAYTSGSTTIAAYDLADFIEAKSNVKNKTEKTYATSTENVVVAYVAEGTCDNLASLKGKKVDVIFGKNNEVAYIAVTDDTVDGSFVTAWNAGEDASVVDGVIEIDGVEYDLSDEETVTVSVFGEKLYDASKDADELIDLVVGKLSVKSAKRNFDRNLKADVILNEDGDVVKVDFTFSGNVTGLTVGNATTNTSLFVEEGVVEKVTSSDKVVMINGAVASLHNKEIKDTVRVVKDGEIATAEDIEAGDVLTVIGTGSNTIKTIIASSSVVEGIIDDVDNKTLTIDSNEYYTSRSIIGNTDGELDEASAISALTSYYEENVTAYLNFLGEVVAMVSETEATDVTIGMIVKTNAVAKTDESIDVDYVSVRILTADGSKATYKIYMKDEDDAVETYAAAFLGDTNIGKLVVFSADADRVITLDQTKTKKEDKGIALLAATDEITANGQTLNVIDMTGIASNKVDEDKKTITLDKTYRFNDSTVLFNGHKPADDTEEGLELVSKWSSLCADNSYVFEAADLLIVDNTRVRYCLVATDEYKSESDNYGVVANIKFGTNDDDEDVYFATLFVDGEEVKYELDITDIKRNALEIGDFVKYTVSDGEITDVEIAVKTADFADTKSENNIADEKVLNYLYNAAKDLDQDNEVDTTEDANLTASIFKYLTAKKAQYEVEEVDEGYIYYTDKVSNPAYDAAKDANNDGVVTGGAGKEDTAASADVNKYLPAVAELVLDEDGCIIYDLRIETNDGEFAMFNGNVEDLEGLYVVGYCADTENSDIDILVILD